MARRTRVRTFKGWGKVSEAGWLAIDLVAHCGKWVEDLFLWIVVATDIATGWSECLPLLGREGTSVMACGSPDFVDTDQGFTRASLVCSDEPLFVVDRTEVADR